MASVTISERCVEFSPMSKVIHVKIDFELTNSDFDSIGQLTTLNTETLGFHPDLPHGVRV